MPDAVSLDDVRHVAMLARLELSDDRARSVLKDMNDILAHMAVLGQVKTSGVSETAAIGNAAMCLRDDQGPPIPLAEPPSAVAPEMRDGFFVVPRLASHEDIGSESA